MYLSSTFKSVGLIIVGSVLTLVTLVLVNPLLPEHLSLGITSPVVESTSDGVSITYDVPTSEEIEAAVAFEAYVPPEQLVQDPVNIPMPLDVVGQPYITAFNKLVNQGVLMEKQLKANVAPAMYSVQTEAAIGNFAKMFTHMEEARAQIAILNTIITDFNQALIEYRAAYASPGMTVAIRTNSQALDRSAVLLHTEVTRFSDLLAKSVDGTVPSQQLISDTEAANSSVVDAAAAFGTQVTAVGDAVKTAARP